MAEAETEHYGIAVFHHIGDVLCATPIAQQLKVSNPNCRVTLFTSQSGFVSVDNNPFIDELVVIDGNEYELDKEIPLLKTLRPWKQFFTPAAYMNYGAIPGGSIQTPQGTIFGIVKASAKINWTIPYIFSLRLREEEIAAARKYWGSLPAGIKILVESDYRSEQSPWTEEYPFVMAEALRALDPVFVFTARDKPAYLERLQAQNVRVAFCAEPFRLNAEFFNLCDAFIGVSSGISALTFSDYCVTNKPRIEVTRGEHWGGAELGHHSDLMLCYSRERFEEALVNLKVRLQGKEIVPDFSPRLAKRANDSCCAICNESLIETPFAPHLFLCPTCRVAQDISSKQPNGAVPPFAVSDIEHYELIAETLKQLPAPTESRLLLLGKVSPGMNDYLKRQVAEVRCYSIDHLAGEFLASALPRKYFDAVILPMGLTGSSAPLEILEKANYVLRIGGLLAISTPNIESISASILRADWEWFERPSLKFFCGPRVIRELAIQAGFVIDTWKTDHGTYGQRRAEEVLKQAKPELNQAQIAALCAEMNRIGHGERTTVFAKPRGGYCGRVMDVAEQPKQQPLRKKPLGVFLNQPQALCSIFESGKMMFEALARSDNYDLLYFELEPTNSHTIPPADFYFFNYHHATMAWLDTKSVRKLPGKKITMVLEMLPGNPFVYCSPEDFDAYCVLDPTMAIENSNVYAFPRPLEPAPEFRPYQEKDIPVIGSFGFGTAGKGFEYVVDAVNREFDRAVIRINIPPATFADADTVKLHKMPYADYLRQLCEKIAKPGISVQVTRDFLTKDQLIQWCADNTLNCFLYCRDQPGLSATTDQAITSGRPLIVSANETFRHIHQYLAPYPLQSLKEAIRSSGQAVQTMADEWSPRKTVLRFEKVLSDLGVLPPMGDLAKPKLRTKPKPRVLLQICNSREQSGQYLQSSVLARCLKKYGHYESRLKSAANLGELQHLLRSEAADAVLIHYDSKLLPWLNRGAVDSLAAPCVALVDGAATPEDSEKADQIFRKVITSTPQKPLSGSDACSIGRLLPLYCNRNNIPDLTTIGIVGLADNYSGIEQFVTRLRSEYSSARLFLHLPPQTSDDFKVQQARIIARTLELLQNTGIEVAANTEFLALEQLLEYFARNTINVLIDNDRPQNELPAYLDCALAVQRPVALGDARAFAHVSSRLPATLLANSSISEIIGRGVAELVPLNADWSEANFVHEFQQILDSVLPPSSRIQAHEQNDNCGEIEQAAY